MRRRKPARPAWPRPGSASRPPSRRTTCNCGRWTARKTLRRWRGVALGRGAGRSAVEDRRSPVDRPGRDPQPAGTCHRHPDGPGTCPVQPAARAGGPALDVPGASGAYRLAVGPAGAAAGHRRG
ncbi:hypothetical protein G6F68_015564 [Rhizopus microsporus]|nr:hypothetical protein G6F68_015564 [Rhizopus microsporus]